MKHLVIGTPRRVGQDIYVGGTHIDNNEIPAHTIMPLAQFVGVILDGKVHLLPVTKGLHSMEVDTKQRGKCLRPGVILVQGRHTVHVNPVWTDQDEIGCHGFMAGDAFLSDRYLKKLTS